MNKNRKCMDCGKIVSNKSKRCKSCSNKNRVGYIKKGTKFDEKGKENIRLSKMGSKNPAWKGDNVGYKQLHMWIRKHKPKSMFCEKCGKTTDKLEVSSTNHTYKRDISEWRWLCKKCHGSYHRRIRHEVLER